MKTLKPLVLVLAGVLITVALFSFKMDAPKKEYCTANYTNVGGWTIINPDLTETKTGKGELYPLQVKLTNDLSKEGWELKSTSSPGAFNICLYFERVKQ